MKSPLRNKTILYLLLIISVVLHFVNLKTLSLSNDELSAITRAKYDTFMEMIRQGVYIDYHPAGIEIFIFYWIKLFGDGDFLLRLPFVFFGIASAWLLFEIARRWLDEFTALVSVVLFISSTLVLQYTQIARMYSSGMFFCLLAAYGWTRYLFEQDLNEKGRRKVWWLWVIGTILALHNHYFSFALVGFIGLSGIFFVKAKDRAKYLIGGLIAVLTFIPELPIFLEQMKTGDIGGWLGAPDKTFLWDFFVEVFNHSWTFLALIAVWLIAGVLSPIGFSNVTRWRILSVSWFFLVFLLAYLYSVLGHPVIQYSTLLFGLPFFFIFIASFTPAFLKQKQVFVIATLTLFGVSTLVASGYYSVNQFGVFRDIAMDVNEFPAGTPTVVNVINPKYFDYYYSKLDDRSKPIVYQIVGPSDVAKLIHTVDTSTSNDFGYVWSNFLHPYEIIEAIRAKYPFLKTKKMYFNSTSYLFSKDSTGAIGDTALFTAQNYFENDPLRPNLTNEIYYSATTSQKVDSGNIISDVISTSLNGFSDTAIEIKYAAFAAKVYFDKMPEKAVMVLSFDDSTHSYVFHQRIFKDFCFEPKKWYTMLIAEEFPLDCRPTDRVNAYFLNPANEKFWIDDMKFTIRASHDPYKKRIIKRESRK